MLEEILKALATQIVTWAGQFPVVTAIIMGVGVLRLVMKPLMDFLRAFVLATPSTGDDEFLATVEASKAWQVVLYVLDWIGSIKTPVRKVIEKTTP